MWFKNARIYTVDLSEDLKKVFRNPEALEDALAQVKFKPVTAMEMSSSGFAPIFGRAADVYSFASAGNCFVKIIEEQKLLPSSIVNQAVMDEIENRENQLKRPLKKDEKAAIKTAILQEMMSKAFASRKELFIWVNYDKGYVAVSATSAKRAENAIALLRSALESFPAKPLAPRVSVEDKLSTYVRTNDLPPGFSLGADAVLKSIGDEGATVRISRDELTSKEVINHLDAGKEVTDLQLYLEEDTGFMLSSDLTVKRVSISDQYLERNLPEKTDDTVSDLQSFLIVEADILTNIVTNIKSAFDCA